MTRLADTAENKTGAETHASAILVRQRKALIDRIGKIGGAELLKQHARAIDDYLRMRFEKSMVGPSLKIETNPYAIIALGGYGRQEQCVHSDVDLLFLFEKYIPEQAEHLVQEVVYPLWDIGLEVGYALRTVKETLVMCRKDFEVLTPLLDARLVCGMSLVFMKLMDRIKTKLLSKQCDEIVRWLVETNNDRHHRFGDSTYLLEPNLKEGQGGLRDYHTMLWIARVKYDLAQPRDLEYSGALSHREYESLIKALSFIWDVRNRLHLMEGRKMDQLIFENQIKLANMLEFRKINGQEPVEVFLSTLHTQMEFIKEQHHIFLHESGYAKKTGRKKQEKRTRHADIIAKNDALYFSCSEAILRSPLLLIQIFEESLRLKIPLEREARRLVEEFGFYCDETFSTSVPVIQIFERILKGSALSIGVLKEMLNTGFLVRLIPQFSRIVNRIQYDAYHLYPVDLHLLRTVEAMSRFGMTEGDQDESIYRNIFLEVKDRNVLFWAALLHDIGKGDPETDHSEKGADIARSVIISKGYSSQEADTVSFLVKEHLLLMKTATRRDIQDEETAIFCARRIEDVNRLKMLYLLTVADSKATGPKAWSSWTEALLRDLFLKTFQVLEKGELATREVKDDVERKKKIILKSFGDPVKQNWMESLFEVMSPRYLVYTQVQDIMEHSKMFRRLGKDLFNWKVLKGKDSSTRSVVICAKDRSGLFSKIAGVFTLSGINILDVQAYTWKNQIALDIFTVKPPSDVIFEKERWEIARKNLNAALTGELDLSTALKSRLSGEHRLGYRSSGRPSRVVVDNTSSSFFTIIEVFADDFPGLLFVIADALFKCNLDIRVAKIATKVDQVVDVFYVRDFYGQKADSEEQEVLIRSTLEAALQRPVGGEMILKK
jgi:[protein-PII] uridylyltransferase